MSAYLTVNCDEHQNPREVFGKADDGWTPHLEDCCIPSSLALQYGCPAAVLADKLRFRRGYPPEGVAGQAQSLSLSDAVGKAVIDLSGQTGDQEGR